MKRFLFATLIVMLLLSSTSCSIRRLAVNKVGNALAGSGSTFSSDNDPELVKSAAPFSLKLMESLLSESPNHKGLLLASASGFAQYAYAFVHQEADEMEETDVKAAAALKARARRLYLRARDYGLRGLELQHPGFTNALTNNPTRALADARPKDVPWLYWTAVSWAAAISVSKDSPELIADVPKVEALIDRALALDEAYDYGAIHTFLISYEMTRTEGQGDPATRARKHFDRAMELTRGQMAGPLVSLAEAVAVQQQDAAGFKSLLTRALAVDPDARPEWRLNNLVTQRRARWLLARMDELFLNSDTDNKETK